MSMLEINELELQIDALLQSIRQFQAENNALREKLACSHHEKDLLEKNHYQAAEKIKHIISRLKEGLHESG